MILYHFTSARLIPPILREGLSRGDVPLSERGGDNAVNLTQAATPHGHGFALQPELITEVEAKNFLSRTGIRVQPGSMWPDKSEARICVKIPTTDRRLVRWSQYVRKRMDPAWRRALEHGHRPETWWLFFGTIPAREFVRIEYRHGSEYRLDCPYDQTEFQMKTPRDLTKTPSIDSNTVGDHRGGDMEPQMNRTARFDCWMHEHRVVIVPSGTKRSEWIKSHPRWKAIARRFRRVRRGFTSIHLVPQDHGPPLILSAH